MSLIEGPRSPPESFVVRVYRRDTRGIGRIAGTVEIVASGTERSFTGMRELQQILGAKARTPQRAKPNRGGPP
jgi:hypothetical protein